MSPPGNLAASIHQRLLNKATQEYRPFNELLQYYTIERFLYRLGQSQYCENFILKGALAFLAWQVPLTRPTRDMDFLAYMENSIENLVQTIQEICMETVEPDGITFPPESVAGEIIKEDAEYQGVRISFLGYLGKAKVPMRLDVGFADIVTPVPVEQEISTVLENMKPPCLRIYPPETVIAEKFQTMVLLGMVNSRMKDFYDLWFMVQSMEFDFGSLKEAISNTFRQRNTPLPREIPIALTIEFAVQKQAQWEAFLKKNKLEETPKKLVEVTQILANFFEPLISGSP